MYDEKLGAFYGATSYSLHDVGERSSVAAASSATSGANPALQALAFYQFFMTGRALKSTGSIAQNGGVHERC